MVRLEFGEKRVRGDRAFRFERAASRRDRDVQGIQPGARH